VSRVYDLSGPHERAAYIDHCNRRHYRPGLFGSLLDSASGRELDRQGGIHGCSREPATLLGWSLPWGQRDETYRKRIFLHYQDKAETERLARLPNRCPRCKRREREPNGTMCTWCGI